MHNQLVGFEEVRQLLGRSSESTTRLTRRADFPAPVQVLRRGRLWRASDIMQWAAATLPLRSGRPRKERS